MSGSVSERVGKGGREGGTRGVVVVVLTSPMRWKLRKFSSPPGGANASTPSMDSPGVTPMLSAALSTDTAPSEYPRRYACGGTSRPAVTFLSTASMSRALS